MALIEIDRHPTERQLRWFGILLAGFVVLAGALARWQLEEPTAARWTWAGGATVVAAHAAVRPLRRWIYLGWLYAAFPIGWAVSHLLLAAAYYVVLTPIGILMRWIVGDPLDRARDRDASTYWAVRRPASDVRRYFRQF